MLRTRLWMGSLLIVLAVVLLLEDRWFAPWFPIFGVVYLLTSLLAFRELATLIPPEHRPRLDVLLPVAIAFVVANWLPRWLEVNAWHTIVGVLIAGTIYAFCAEMRHYHTPGGITQRLALTVFAWVYLGIMPSCFVQLRWLPISTTAIALAVFVPKCNDIGAYFTGKFLTGSILGRTPMTPLLSPKKTWQGFTGGMLASVAITLGINAMSPVFATTMMALCFALTVGLWGVLGDLAESLIKRDLQTKDASQAVPGFGGVLDVIDSLLFTAPVVWLWFWYFS